tara:strand:+ start:435 stop:1775 length:1341 start_codon:yes stop_codon:yes gene_type:complete
MINSVSKTAMVAIAFLVNAPVFASDESNLTQLKDYLLAKKFTQAYDYSKSLEAELAGELSYDFLSGLAAFGTKRYQSAIFSFERVVINDPSSFEGRYYLALSYQKVDNLHAAVTEFEILLDNTSTAKSLTSVQIGKVERQLQAVKKQLVNRMRRWSNDIAFSVGSDSNINSGSAQDDITLPDGTVIPLFDSSKEIADESFSVKFHSRYQHPISQFQSLLFDFSAQEKNYFKHSEYDRKMFRFAVKYKHAMVDDSSWYVGLSTVPLWFSNEKYRTEEALTFGWQQPIDNTSQYGVNGLISNVENFVYEGLDFNRYQMNAFYRFYTTFQHTFMLKWYQDSNKKGLKHNDKTAVGASYMLGYAISDVLSVNTMLMYEQQKYAQPNPLFNVYSDSALAIISTELLYSGFEKQVIQLQLNYQNKAIDSELLAMKIFEYNSLELNLTWKYEF